MLNRIRSTALIALAAFTFASCSGESSITAQSPETINFASALNVDLSQMTRTATGLYKRDLAVGNGTEAVAGKTVGMRYTGHLSSGTVFDFNLSGVPFGFKLGNNEVIKGWDEGIVGMKIGGRRQLVIPPALGYGNTSYSSIPAGSVLVFTVELISVAD